jgi:hypothetical protein
MSEREAERLFPLDVAAELSGMHPQTVRNIIAEGVLVPAVLGSTGTGRGHQLTLTQIIALALGERMMKEGADRGRWTGCVHFLSRLSASRLKTYIDDKEETIVVPTSLVTRALREAGQPQVLMPGMMIKPRWDDPTTTPTVRRLFKLFDVGEVKKWVLARVARMDARKDKRRRQRLARR